MCSVKMQDRSAHVTDVWVNGFEKKGSKYVSFLPQVTAYILVQKRIATYKGKNKATYKRKTAKRYLLRQPSRFAAPAVTQFWRKPLLFCYQNFSHTPEKYFAPMLPEEQNVSHQINILLQLFCYLNCRMFLIREIFCSSADTRVEYFSLEKYQVCWYHNSKSFVYRISDIR